MITAISLTPVWVPYGDEPVEKKSGRGSARGPNGEDPTSGRWKLMLPDGGVYEGPTVSPSALETAMDCMHKWGLSRLDNLSKPENHSAMLGTIVHGQLERWLTFGKIGGERRIEGMSRIYSHFPSPGQCESEVYFGFIYGEEGKEVVFAGYLDARSSILSGLVDHTNSIIHDLKTTGNMQWMKTPAQLRANIQVAVYALGEMLRIEEALGKRCDAVVVSWTWAQIKEEKDGSITIKRTETVSDDVSKPGVLITREEAEHVIHQYLPIAEKIIDAIGNGKKAKDLDKNFESCAAYGGCPWKKTDPPACEVPSGGGFMAMMRQERLRTGVLIQENELVKIGTKSKPQISNGGKMAGLADRFAKKLNGNETSATVTSTATVVKDEPKKAGGLAGRFAKSGTAEKKAEPPAEKAVDKKATETGVASGAEKTSEAPKAGGTLKDRLKNLAKGNGAIAAKVDAAVDAAPKHNVGEGIGAIAVGINPPDAAPEWTEEQQAAESEKISGAGKKQKEEEVAKGEPEKKKRGPGRPAKAATAPEETQLSAGATIAVRGSALVPVDGYSLQAALIEIDGIATKLLGCGARKEAMLLLQASEMITMASLQQQSKAA